MTEIIAHFFDVFDEKKCSLLHFPIILVDLKNVLQFTHFHQFCFKINGKDEVFHGLLCHIVVIYGWLAEWFFLLWTSFSWWTTFELWESYKTKREKASWEQQLKWLGRHFSQFSWIQSGRDDGAEICQKAGTQWIKMSALEAWMSNDREMSFDL